MPHESNPSAKPGADPITDSPWFWLLVFCATKYSAASAGERQPGVGSVSAPVLGPYDIVVAVVSVSGPATRMGRTGGRRYAGAVLEATREIERALGGSDAGSSRGARARG